MTLFQVLCYFDVFFQEFILVAHHQSEAAKSICSHSIA